MDREPSPVGGERDEVLDAPVGSSGAARYFARERQKRELRRERDAIVARLAGELGERGLAEHLGLTEPVAGKLVAGARARLAGEASAPIGAQLRARRVGVDPERWADADAHYEALGRGPALRDRRGASRRF